MIRNLLVTKSRNYPRALVLAGLAGAVAEVAWIGLYCVGSPLSGPEVLAGIARAVGADALPLAWQPIVGMFVHLALAVALAIAFGLALKAAIRRGLRASAILPLSIGTLMAVWVMNFGVVLPRIAPEFVALMPAGITAMSKLMFGMAMGVAIHGFVSHPLRTLPVGRRPAA